MEKNIDYDLLRQMENLYLSSVSNKEKDSYYCSKLHMFHKNLMTLKIDDFVDMNIGDIYCFDYGCAYRYEIGYQHLGIILAKSKSKVFVAPIISAKKTYYNENTKVLLKPDKENNLVRNSFVLINDVKWINATRKIFYCGHISENSNTFALIRQKVISMMFSRE